MKWFVRPFLVSAGVSAGVVVGDILSRSVLKAAARYMMEYDARQGEDK